MHMLKEHSGVAPVKKPCDMGLFSSHLSLVLKNNISRKHLDSLKTFKCNKCDFFSKEQRYEYHNEHLKHKKEATLMCELCDYMTSNAQYLKSHMQALCQADY